MGRESYLPMICYRFILAPDLSACIGDLKEFLEQDIL